MVNVVSDSIDDFDPRRRIEENDYKRYSTIIERYIKHDSESALCILQIIKDKPKSENKTIYPIYREKMMELGWDKTVFEVSSNRTKGGHAYIEAVGALLSEFNINGYVTNNGRGNYELLDRGTEVLDTKDISPKGDFDIKNRIKKLIGQDIEISNDELISRYASKYGFYPNDDLKETIIKKKKCNV